MTHPVAIRPTSDITPSRGKLPKGEDSRRRPSAQGAMVGMQPLSGTDRVNRLRVWPVQFSNYRAARLTGPGGRLSFPAPLERGSRRALAAAP